jgi:DNA-binding phage protein
VNDLKSSQPLVDSRGAAFARLASRIIEALNDAVEYRRQRGETMTSISDKLGWHRSALTRALNGTSRNLTVRTVSDILWATDFDPRDFCADPVEEIAPNFMSVCNEDNENFRDLVRIYDTKTVEMDPISKGKIIDGSVYSKPEIEFLFR